MNEEIPKLLTPDDLEVMLGVPKATFNNWAWRGIGPDFIRVGRHRRYRLAAVEAWLDANTH